MEIYIPTYDRVEKQTTLEYMPQVWRDRTTLVCYKEEAPLHVERGRRVWVMPEEYGRGIGNKRRFIHENATDEMVIMFDDDLRFNARRNDDPTKFRDMEPQDWDDMFLDMRMVFNAGYIHGAIAVRGGAHMRPEPYLYNNRALRAHFIHRDAPATYKPEYMQDFTMTLDLLTQGHPNIILNRWVQDQKASNTPGGVSGDRDLTKLSEAAHTLKARHPKFVSLVQRETVQSWGGAVRTDVRIQWKQAIKWGMANAEAE